MYLFELQFSPGKEWDMVILFWFPEEPHTVFHSGYTKTFSPTV